MNLYFKACSFDRDFRYENVFLNVGTPKVHVWPFFRWCRFVVQLMFILVSSEVSRHQARHFKSRKSFIIFISSSLSTLYANESSVSVVIYWHMRCVFWPANAGFCTHLHWLITVKTWVFVKNPKVFYNNCVLIINCVKIVLVNWLKCFWMCLRN